VAALLRSEVMKVAPELGRYLQPKCGEHRMGYCDETEQDWEECPIGRVRPHKSVLFRIYESYRKGELQPLREQDWASIEEIDEPVEAPAPS
jgi:thymidylate synthase (FAD)